jgi:HEAT repeat protein
MPENREWFTRALSHDDPEVRWIAVVELAGEHSDDSVDLLIQALQDKDFTSIRWRAAVALGEQKNRAATGALIDALADVNEHVREEAAVALGKIGDESAIPALIRSLGDSGRGVRLRAVRALESIGPAAEPALKKALGVEGNAFSYAVRDALDGIAERKGRMKR